MHKKIRSEAVYLDVNHFSLIFLNICLSSSLDLAL